MHTMAAHFGEIYQLELVRAIPLIGYHYLNRQKKTGCRNNREKWVVLTGISVHGQRYLGYC